MRKLKGCLAPIPTPFDEAGELYFDGLKRNLEVWAKSSLDGIVVMGSNGEFVMLTQEEKLKLLEFVRENYPKDKLLIAGTSCESYKETLFFNKKAYEFGYDAVLVLPPSYYKGSMTNDVLENYYLKLADDSPIPVLIYNMPANSGINLQAKLVVKLSSHPNILGIKDSSGNIVQISEIVCGARKGFAVFAGSANFLLSTLVMGGVGGIMALANVIPDVCSKIIKNFEDGNIAKARELQLLILKINAFVTSTYGVPGLKAALDIVGLYGGPPRLPLLPLPKDKVEEIRKEVAKVLEQAS
ncbi:MAG: dihydrodipicolinate synthase family protein [Synergistetes bacterium]|nr:dihydrodipicolinate synthase family protein [Synergistota bacterium]MCX8128343.1 dihydrodipicolinate synthase family protein [Synergistota bacterium]MDW8192998.1 dihydrodipicolinate synthase family protein [Synergistota bacterium]